MSIDSAEKRRAISGIHYIGGPGVTPLVGKDREWRQQVGYGYPGISAATVHPPVNTFMLLHVGR